MSAIKIIAIDIDATLLNSNHQLTDNVKNAIKSASKKGIKVVLTSGRPISGIRPFLKQLDLDDRNDQYVISFGGGVVETTSGKIISARSLSYEDYLDLQNIATKLGLHFHVESSERLFTSDRDLGKYTIVEGYLVNIPVCFRLPDELRDETLIKAMYIDDPEKIEEAVKHEELFNQLSGRITFTRSTPMYYEANPKGTDKGSALQILIDKLGLTQENVMAIGDQGNDLSMVKFAGTGIAMGNAIDELKECAQHVTSDCDHDGVAEAIEKWAL